MSIEHEDGLMTPKEGLEKAIKFLKRVMIFEEQNGMYVGQTAKKTDEAGVLGVFPATPVFLVPDELKRIAKSV